MTMKPTTPPNDSSQLPEIDLADMEAVTGGCATCGCGQQQQQGTSKLAALAPMLANQAGR